MKIVKTPAHYLALICAVVAVTSLGLGAVFSLLHGSDIADLTTNRAAAHEIAANL